MGLPLKTLLSARAAFITAGVEVKHKVINNMKINHLSFSATFLGMNSIKYVHNYWPLTVLFSSGKISFA